MGHGSTAKKVVAYNTAMEHAAAAYDKTNLNALNNPWSAEGKARVNDINLVSQEIGNAISTGVLAQKEATKLSWPDFSLSTSCKGGFERSYQIVER